MSELLENTPNNSEQKPEQPSVSLDDRKQQLEDKIKKETNEVEKMPARMKSPYDSPPTTGYNQKSPGTRMQLPKMNAAPPNHGSSFDVYNHYNNYNSRLSQPTPQSYETNVYANASPYMNSDPPKQSMANGTKSYLIILSGILIIFVLGFVMECVRTYNTYGVFGGNEGILSKDYSDYFDSDRGFGFKFRQREDSDSDSGSEKKDTDKTVSSSEGTVKAKKAPDESTVVNKNAAVIKAKDQPEDIDSAKYSARQAFKRVENSVVNVMVFSGDKVDDEDDADGTGSGIIISEDGYIVTNSHVIGDSKSNTVKILTTEGDSFFAAVVGYDSRTDLAVLKVDASGLTAAEFVNSDQIEVGQDAIAVGNPGGLNYSNSLTRGCVSALNRTVSSNKLVPYIQTDAAINPGNSGGPLLNSAGQVMGITTIKIANASYEGMGFAIPSNTVVSIANDLIGQGYVSGRVRLGIVGMASDEDPFKGLPAGITIASISDDSPFKGTNVEVGDIITAIDGTEITSFQELYSELDNYNPGDTARITLYRGATSLSSSKSFIVEITLIADNGETQHQ